MTTHFPAFRAELKANIERAIRKARRQGTVGMSMDCLMQNVQPPCCAGPTGANMRRVYADMFRAVVHDSPVARRFVY